VRALHLFLLPLREKVAAEGGRMRARAALSSSCTAPTPEPDRPVRPLIRHAAHDTFSRKGRRGFVT